MTLEEALSLRVGDYVSTVTCIYRIIRAPAVISYKEHPVKLQFLLKAVFIEGDGMEYVSLWRLLNGSWIRVDEKSIILKQIERLEQLLTN